MLYEFLLVLATIVILSLLWVILAYPLSVVTATFKAVTPDTVANVSVNKTDINSMYDVPYLAFYYSLLVISIVLFIYVVKVAVEHQAATGGLS
jgi:hypothetical protein